MSEPTDDLVADETRDTESDEATMSGQADRMPTPEEEQAAEKNDLDPNAADAYKDAAERGANVKGEGEV